MKKFFKILGKSILLLVLGILVILGIILTIILSDCLKFCFNDNGNKFCYDVKLNVNEKQIYNSNILPNGKIIEGIREFNNLNGFYGDNLIKKGTPNGIQTYHYKNGNIGIKCYYKYGELDDEFIGYYKNGQIIGDINYVNGNEDGKYVIYYKNGNVLLEGNYDNGKRIGIWTGYLENGEVEKVFDYDKGDFDSRGENLFIDLLNKEIYSK